MNWTRKHYSTAHRKYYISTDSRPNDSPYAENTTSDPENQSHRKYTVNCSVIFSLLFATLNYPMVVLVLSMWSYHSWWLHYRPVNFPDSGSVRPSNVPWTTNCCVLRFFALNPRAVNSSMVKLWLMNSNCSRLLFVAVHCQRAMKARLMVHFVCSRRRFLRSVPVWWVLVKSKGWYWFRGRFVMSCFADDCWMGHLSSSQLIVVSRDSRRLNVESPHFGLVVPNFFVGRSSKKNK